ncbi:hypothetical protein PInf_006674 [Phytophthora infestans]|nr:hypothetical protein PInf_006674 [Phytophthora infestans]
MVRAAGADGSTGTVPQFTPILPPMIKSVSRSMEAEKMRLRINVQSADATEGMLLAEIEHIVSIKNDTLPDIKNCSRRIWSSTYERVCESSFVGLLQDKREGNRTRAEGVNSAVDENGLPECCRGPNGTKEKWKRVIASLLPKSLKQEVNLSVRFTHADAARDPKVLFRPILSKANELERQHVRLKREKRDVTGQSKDKSKLDQSDKRKLCDPKPSAASTNNNNADRRPADNKPKYMFYKDQRNPAGTMPELRECTQVSRQEKEELYKKMRDARRNKKAKLKRLGELLPSADRVVLLNGVVELPYCPDSGSDFTVIGHSHCEKLKTLEPSLTTEKLEVPVLNHTFGSVTVTAKVKAKLHLVIHTAAGLVEPMNMVDVLVVDVDDGEFINSDDPIDPEADEMPVNLDVSEPSGDDNIFAAVERLIDRALEMDFL